VLEARSGSGAAPAVDSDRVRDCGRADRRAGIGAADDDAEAFDPRKLLFVPLVVSTSKVAPGGGVSASRDRAAIEASLRVNSESTVSAGPVR
jgi:hypothetical protein